VSVSYDRVTGGGVEDAAAVQASPARTERRSRWPWLAALLVLLLCALRLIHLTADTPGWLSPTSAGEYVDEGYKTLSARNLSLFGRTHWHPEDDYTGWMKTSLITNGSYFLAFEVAAPNLPTARVVTIVYFGLFLGAFALAFRGRYPNALIGVGLLVLGLDGALFFFSRIALFEIPIVFFLYGWLFLMTRVRESSVWWPLAAALLVSPVLGFGLKLSALVYLAPIWFGLFVRAIVLRGLPRSPMVWAGLAFGGVGVAVMLVVTRGLWATRIGINPVGFVSNISASPLPVTGGFLVLAGWLAALHLAVTRTREVLTSPYRCALLSLALLGPLVFGLFAYDPPRYYVPILPAYALAVCEWFARNGRRIASPGRGWWMGLALVIGLAVWFHAALRITNDLVLARLPIDAGEAPGLGRRAMFIAGVPLATIAAVVCWALRSRTLSGPVVQSAIVVSLVLWLAQSAARIGDFITAPRFAGDAIRSELVKVVPPQSSIIGDWAPFFALGTDLRPLYMNHMFNRAERIDALRPDYFVHSETADSEASRAVLRASESVTLGAPVLSGRYNDREVVIYPLEYRDAAAQ